MNQRKVTCKLSNNRDLFIRVYFIRLPITMPGTDIEFNQSGSSDRVTRLKPVKPKHATIQTIRYHFTVGVGVGEASHCLFNSNGDSSAHD